MESSPAELIALFGLNRHANLQLLRKIKVEDLSKSAFHPEFKRDMDVAEIVQRMAVHGPNHLGQIERLKKEVGKKPN